MLRPYQTNMVSILKRADVAEFLPFIQQTADSFFEHLITPTTSVIVFVNIEDRPTPISFTPSMKELFTSFYPPGTTTTVEEFAMDLYNQAKGQDKNATEPVNTQIRTVDSYGQLRIISLQIQYSFYEPYAAPVTAMCFIDKTQEVLRQERLGALLAITGQRASYITVDPLTRKIVELNIKGSSITLEAGSEHRYVGRDLLDLITDESEGIQEEARRGYSDQLQTTYDMYLAEQSKPPSERQRIPVITRTYTLRDRRFSVDMTCIEGLVYLLSTDITEVTEALTIAQEAVVREAAIRAFLRAFAHDAAQPVTQISTGIYILQRIIPDIVVKVPEADAQAISDKVTQFANQLDALKLAGDLLKDIIGQLREFAELGKDTVNIKPAQFGILELVEKVTRSLSEESYMRLEQDLPSAEIQILSDQVLLQRVIMNLVDNAMKYSPETSSVALNMRLEREGIVLEVVDHGIGIPVKDQDRIFMPLFRASNVGDVGGTGVGLASCRRIVHLLGGQLNYITQQEVGTTFILWLPLKFAVET